MKGEFWKLDYEAWDEGTVELTLEEEGAFLRICNNLYRRGGQFPNSERLLCSLWRCHPNKARMLLAKLIEYGKVEVVDGMIRNRRALAEIEARSSVSASRATSGRLGGIRSGQVRGTQGDHPPTTHRPPTDHPQDTLPGHHQADDGKPLKSLCEDEAFALTPTNQRREEEKREDRSSLRSDGAGAPKSKPDEVRRILSEVVSAETAGELIAHRKAIKAPLTNGAAKGLARDLLACGDPEAAATTLMARSWRTIRPDWNQPRAGPVLVAAKATHMGVALKDLRDHAEPHHDRSSAERYPPLHDEQFRLPDFGRDQERDRSRAERRSDVAAERHAERRRALVDGG